MEHLATLTVMQPNHWHPAPVHHWFENITQLEEQAAYDHTGSEVIVNDTNGTVLIEAQRRFDYFPYLRRIISYPTKDIIHVSFGASELENQLKLIKLTANPKLLKDHSFLTAQLMHLFNLERQILGNKANLNFVRGSRGRDLLAKSQFSARPSFPEWLAQTMCHTKLGCAARQAFQGRLRFHPELKSLAWNDDPKDHMTLGCTEIEGLTGRIILDKKRTITPLVYGRSLFDLKDKAFVVEDQTHNLLKRGRVNRAHTHLIITHASSLPLWVKACQRLQKNFYCIQDLRDFFSWDKASQGLEVVLVADQLLRSLEYREYRETGWLQEAARWHQIPPGTKLLQAPGFCKDWWPSPATRDAPLDFFWWRSVTFDYIRPSTIPVFFGSRRISLLSEWPSNMAFSDCLTFALGSHVPAVTCMKVGQPPPPHVGLIFSPEVLSNNLWKWLCYGLSGRDFFSHASLKYPIPGPEVHLQASFEERFFLEHADRVADWSFWTGHEPFGYRQFCLKYMGSEDKAILQLLVMVMVDRVFKTPTAVLATCAAMHKEFCGPEHVGFEAENLRSQVGDLKREATEMHDFLMTLPAFQRALQWYQADPVDPVDLTSHGAPFFRVPNVERKALFPLDKDAKDPWWASVVECELPWFITQDQVESVRGILNQSFLDKHQTKLLTMALDLKEFLQELASPIPAPDRADFDECCEGDGRPPPEDALERYFARNLEEAENQSSSASSSDFTLGGGFEALSAEIDRIEVHDGEVSIIPSRAPLLQRRNAINPSLTPQNPLSISSAQTFGDLAPDTPQPISPPASPSAFHPGPELSIFLPVSDATPSSSSSSSASSSSSSSSSSSDQSYLAATSLPSSGHVNLSLVLRPDSLPWGNLPSDGTAEAWPSEYTTGPSSSSSTAAVDTPSNPTPDPASQPRTPIENRRRFQNLRIRPPSPTPPPPPPSSPEPYITTDSTRPRTSRVPGRGVSVFQRFFPDQKDITPTKALHQTRKLFSLAQEFLKVLNAGTALVSAFNSFANPQLCVTCMVDEAKVLLTNCGHRICAWCLPRVRAKCPHCRTRFSTTDCYFWQPESEETEDKKRERKHRLQIAISCLRTHTNRPFFQFMVREIQQRATLKAGSIWIFPSETVVKHLLSYFSDGNAIPGVKFIRVDHLDQLLGRQKAIMSDRAIPEGQVQVVLAKYSNKHTTSMYMAQARGFQGCDYLYIMGSEIDPRYVPVPWNAMVFKETRFVYFDNL